MAKNGRIHGLFNNAGGQFPAPAAAMSAKGFDVVVRNNLTGGFIVSREVYTQSMQKHGGSIVNMAADMRNGFPNMAHTGAARAGMVNLTMTPGLRMGRRGRARERGGAGLDRLVAAWTPTRASSRSSIPKLKDHCPLGRLGTESEVSARGRASC